ncbi:MAG: peptidoglycan DD-metalloendopeptidase family protein [Christensenellaceae bacterium]
MQQQANKKFAKKNIYLILLAVGIIVVAIAVSVALSNRSDISVEVGKSTSDSKISSSSSINDSKSNSATASDSDNPTSSSGQGSDKSDEPIKRTEFLFPVANGEILVNYTEASVVYNKTLGIYTGHMGIDVTGAENAEVLCVQDGVVESVTTSYLEGTTVIVDHGDGVKSLYNSLELSDDITVGKTLERGQVMGKISTTNRKEYKDGPHLHFEMLKDGKTVNPFDYLEDGAK